MNHRRSAVKLAVSGSWWWFRGRNEGKIAAMRAARCALGGLLIAFALVVSPAAGEEDACAEARRSHAWCEAEGAGFIAGIEIRSEVLWEALDAHGHDVDVERLGCDVCRKAKAGGGFCDEHAMGWAGGMAYLSRLTYHLARAESLASGSLACTTCRKHAETVGWCEECGLGIVGNIAFRDREEFEEMVRQIEVLRTAIERSGDCEICAGALIIDGRCPGPMSQWQQFV